MFDSDYALTMFLGGTNLYINEANRYISSGFFVVHFLARSTIQFANSLTYLMFMLLL